MLDQAKYLSKAYRPVPCAALYEFVDREVKPLALRMEACYRLRQAVQT